VRPVVLLLLGACSFGVPAQGAGDASPDIADDAAPEAPACFEMRCRRITITIHHEQVIGGPHTAFPLYVDVTDPMLDRDLVFTAADGVTVLPYERDVQKLDRLLAWVRVPVLPSDRDTVIQLYTGDPTAPESSNAAAVWDAGYQAVWHASDQTGGNNAIKDSTSHTNNGTDVGGLTVGAGGKLGRGLAFDGIDDAMQVRAHPTLTSSGPTGTLGLWINWAAPRRPTTSAS
jgi:hypothetical protein